MCVVCVVCGVWLCGVRCAVCDEVSVLHLTTPSRKLLDHVLRG